MFKKLPLLAAFLAVALTAQAAPTKNIPITQSQIPLTISTPGTYILTGNLTTVSNAIIVNAPIAGPVIIGLKGFSITGPGPSTAGIIVEYSGFFDTSPPITIRNGTISNFLVGLSVENQNNVTVGNQTNVTINKIVFNEPPSTTQEAGVELTRNSSTVIENCTFSFGSNPGSASNGIIDFESVGESYNNNTFIKINIPLFIQNPDGATTTLERYQFALPSSFN
jgi:hypothetical protein